MKKLILPVVIAAAAVILASCSSAPKLYEWYKYTDTTYQYIKAGDDEATTKLFEVYQKVIDGQEKVRIRAEGLQIILNWKCGQQRP